MTLACTALLAGLASIAAPPEAPATVLFGVDDAGAPGMCIDHPRAAEMYAEMGAQFLVTHYPFPQPDLAGYAASIHHVDDFCTENGLEWVYNLEHPNFIKSFVDEKGRDWFNTEDGRHFWLMPDDMLEEFGKCHALWGFMYDEAAHMQNCANMISEVNKPWIYDPGDDTLDQASDHFTRAVREIGDHYAKYGVRLSTEEVFPVLFHCFDRAGWTAGTKILKENWCPAFIATAMGAALEYDRELWISPDLWFGGTYPGHSPEELRSALLLAYHMGADRIYIENLCYPGEQGTGSLVLLTDDGYQVTPYGEVTKWFSHEYMPEHPRAYSFRDVRPRVAIVRQPDACWGQAGSWLKDRLYGNDAWPSTPATEAWIKIWHLLSRDVISEETLSWNSEKLGGKRPYQVFTPLDGVVVYDHLVSEERLRGVEVIFLTGIGVSADTQLAIEHCVRDGATCVALPNLLPERVHRQTGDAGTLQDGKGLWVATEDFLSDAVREAVADVIPEGDVIRYRFGDTEVRFAPVDGDMNRLAVEVEPAE
jgi:hypothetical protein